MRRTFVGVVLGLMMIFMAGATQTALADQSEREVKINRDTKYGDQQLPKGTYRVRFDESQPSEAVFLHRDREVLRLSYEVMTLERSAPENAVAYRLASDGSLQLARIEFKGKKLALAFK